MVISDMKAQLNLIERTLQSLADAKEPGEKNHLTVEAVEQMRVLREDLYEAQLEVLKRAVITPQT